MGRRRRNGPADRPKGRQIETEAAPIGYVAELIGADTDSERAIRWLIALIVLCFDGDRVDGRGICTRSTA
jgi:hypothetical protein